MLAGFVSKVLIFNLSNKLSISGTFLAKSVKIGTICSIVVTLTNLLANIENTVPKSFCIGIPKELGIILLAESCCDNPPTRTLIIPVAFAFADILSEE